MIFKLIMPNLYNGYETGHSPCHTYAFREHKLLYCLDALLPDLNSRASNMAIHRISHSKGILDMLC